MYLAVVGFSTTNMISGEKNAKEAKLWLIEVKFCVKKGVN